MSVTTCKTIINMRKFIAAFILSTMLCLHGNAQVGTWTLYPAFNQPSQIESVGSIRYVLSEGDLYSCNISDNSVQVYDKSNFLSDCGIDFIGWCQEAKRLVIVYNNQNIDLMDENGNVVNVSDYYSKSLTDDKTIFGLNIFGSYAYLSTGFGIVKLNVKKAEISDTYTLGFKVDWTHIDGDKIIAESQSKGKYEAALSSNLLDKANWIRTGSWTPENRSLDDALKAEVANYNVGGPKYNNFRGMAIVDDKLFTVGGYYDRSGIGKDNPFLIQMLDNGEWTFEGENLEEVVGHTIRNMNYIVVDPTDKNHMYTSGQSGLFEFQDGVFKQEFNIHNSPLWAAVSSNNDPSWALTEAKFDQEGNLWMINQGKSEQQLLMLSKDYEWKQIHVFKGNSKGSKGLANVTVDSRGLVWFAYNHWDNNGLYCYNPQTEQMKEYSKFINEDGIDVTTSVKSIGEDKDGNIWIGCWNGPYYISKESIETGDETFQQVKVPRNDGTNLADYLLAGIEVDCIAVDGANRKWFGTPFNGVFVISDDCYTQEYNFTKDNSTLIYNQILNIAINDNTGEVYIATDKGLCSYRSDASAAAEQLDKNSIYAFPNPVTPDYTGLITITGFTYNASVKIVTAGGSLVAEGMSNGGTFTWDGCDLEGRPVASGVYMVMAATEDAKKGAVCKVAIVR